MLGVVRKISGYLITPVVWTLLTVTLLCLPGSSFPGERIFFEIPHIDKVVHVILFGGLVILWTQYFYLRKRQSSDFLLTIFIIVLAAIFLGVCMEYIQLRYIPKRAFDKGDIIANTVSSIVVGGIFYFLISRKFVKKEWPL
jgi:VanZ family protein